MSTVPVNSCCSSAGLVEKYINTAYDNVKLVADNMDFLMQLYDFLNEYGLTTNVAVKAPVQAVATAPITLYGNQTISWSAHSGDYTTSVTTGMRVLVTSQSDSKDNGIWIVQDVAWTRAPDFNDTTDVVLGTLVFSTQGDAWQVESPTYAVDVGTTPITFRDIDLFAFESVAQAKASADAALVSETNAKASEDSALASKEVAEASAAIASSAETTAVASANSALQSATNAEASSVTAKFYADNAQNILDANTYYITPTDPDGTIAGLAGTANGGVFRVVQGTNQLRSFIYYKNNNGVAEAIADQIGAGVIQASLSLNDDEYFVYGGGTSAGTVTASQSIDINGNIITASSSRRLRAVTMTAGSIVFYSGYSQSRQNASAAEIPGAIFVPTAGAVDVVVGNPLTLSAVQVLDGHYTATTSGTFYINTVNNPNDTVNPYGSLLRGTLGVNIFYHGRTLGEEDIEATVVSKDLHDRDIVAILAAGTPVDLTESVEYVNNIILYNNGSIQTIPSSAPAYNQWAVAYVPVRKGDVVTYNGFFNVSGTSTLTYLSQVGVHKEYIAELFGTTSSAGQYTRTVTATNDGYVAIRVRLANGSEQLSHNIQRTSIFNGSSAIDEETFLESASHEDTVINLGGKLVTALPGYVDNSGTIVSSVTRWYRAAPLEAGQTAFYTGQSQQATSTPTGVPAVVWVPESTGVASIIQDNPLIGAGMQNLDGMYTATEKGILYVNSILGITSASQVSGRVLYGVIGQDIYYSKAVVENASSLEESLLQVFHEADMQSIKANGNSVNVTNLVEKEPDAIWYKNNAKQIGVNPGVVLTAYVPVRKGDYVSYTGYIQTSSNPDTYSLMLQMDTNKVVVEELIGDLGLNGVYTRGATATRDGFVAIRIRYIDPNNGNTINYSISRKSAYFTGVSATGTSGSIVTPSLELLPIRLDTTWLYGSPSYQQNGIVVQDNYQYVVVIAQGRIPHLLQRSVYGGEWKVADLSQIAGNPLASPTAQDGHNSYSIGVTKDGYILVTGNHHVNNCRCVISDNPHDITSWSAISYTDSTVTYPRILKHKDGTTQVFWRQGSSGNGFYYTNFFDDTTRTFGTPFMLIDATASNPYEQTIAVDNSGTIHLCWGYRTTASSADANYGLFYAKSSDKGVTWTNALGTVTYPLPLSESNSEKVANLVTGSGYVNQNGGCVDLNGRYHTVFWQIDENGFTQINHLWFDGASWKQEVVSNFTYTENTSGSLLQGTSSRPQICCTRYGKIYVVYRTTEDGLNGQIRAIDVTTPNVPKDMLLTMFDIGKTEISLNVWDILQDNRIALTLVKGINRVTSAPAGQYLSEPCWLFQAALP
ncbi:tail spike [Klebsiella phage MY01]|nr:tail spike [Pseudomonas phage MY01]